MYSRPTKLKLPPGSAEPQARAMHAPRLEALSNIVLQAYASRCMAKLASGLGGLYLLWLRLLVANQVAVVQAQFFL